MLAPIEGSTADWNAPPLTDQKSRVESAMAVPPETFRCTRNDFATPGAAVVGSPSGYAKLMFIGGTLM